jgi:cell wall-active antibiotic response 4TMS protein YvqF
MRTRYAGFFWPAVLILIGVFALLVNSGIITVDRLYRLVDLWPLILVVIGLQLITRRAFQGPTAQLAAALIVVIAAVGAVAYVALGPSLPGGTQTLDKHDTVGEVTQVTLHLDSTAATTTVAGNGSLGNDLYRAHITYSGPTPDVTLVSSNGIGDLSISQKNNFGFFAQSRRFTLDIQLNPQVQWSFNFNSAASTDTFKLADINVGSMQLNTAASHEDITLGMPKGQVSIAIDGAALTVHIHRPSGTAASAQVNGAVANLTADGRQIHGLGTASWQSDGYDAATDSYNIQVNGAASTVTIDTGAG